MVHEGKYEDFNDRIIRNSSYTKPKTAIDIQIEAGNGFWLDVHSKLKIHHDRNISLICKLKKVRVFEKIMNEYKWTDNESIYNSLRMELSKDELDETVIKYLLNKIPRAVTNKKTNYT